MAVLPSLATALNHAGYIQINLDLKIKSTLSTSNVTLSLINWTGISTDISKWKIVKEFIKYVCY